MKLIDKDKVIAEIKKLRAEAKMYPSYFDCGRLSICDELMTFFDTLEVKEIDLKKEINTWYDYGFPNEEELLDYIAETAKHFFELGLKANQKGYMR